jgi:hypothetical protein
MDQQTGKYIIYFGIIVLIIGGLVYFFHEKLNWLGKLPGDIRVEKENFKFYFPITTMILLSLLVTVIINLIRKLL